MVGRKGWAYRRGSKGFEEAPPDPGIIPGGIRDRALRAARLPLQDLTMAYTHPDALQRVCEEVERTAWVSDRQFFHDHPQREYRLRPAMSAEISEYEISRAEALPCPPGMQIITAVKRIGPGIRARLLIVVPAAVPWVEAPEDVCRAWYDLVCTRDPQLAQLERDLAALSQTFTERQP
jgi:hypothetical protein